MTPEQMAHLHAHAFAGHGRAWSAREFAQLLENPFCYHVGDSHTFAIGRVIADEAELLTLATDPDHRRCGLARDRLLRFENEAAKRRATRAFLEVSDQNSAAVALYLGAGYSETARRRDYYQLADGRRADALIMQKTIS